ncbi:DNA-binding protein [Vitreimonas flagellata]|jgi:DNA-binding phage protein|uniref:helix-turn-helix domain-containing transcriptional regulator n=1 Tax=Vitreimonas flagellata TaxID=2560861 RepID=UPI0010756D13|nr:transcriptional regulator [Vitreimonas flagellata]
MSLTRAFKETVQARAQRDAKFRRALLIEAIEALLAGELQVGKAILRDYINATIGFEALAEAVDINAKSLMRMLGPEGNPQAANLFAVVKRLQDIEGVALELRPVRQRRPSH